MLDDIKNRKDIESLIDSFYKKVIQDEKIGLFFTSVVKLDWEKHIPIMYNFWETILLGNLSYQGNPMLKHIQLNKKHRLHAEHFAHWLSLWESTVISRHHGPNADQAIYRAKQIAQLMEFKVRESEKAD